MSDLGLFSKTDIKLFTDKGTYQIYKYTKFKIGIIIKNIIKIQKGKAE